MQPEVELLIIQYRQSFKTYILIKPKQKNDWSVKETQPMGDRAKAIGEEGVPLPEGQPSLRAARFSVLFCFVFQEKSESGFLNEIADSIF